MLLVEQQVGITPGEFAALPFAVPTEGMEGPFRKRFLVHTDAQEESLRVIELTLRGNVRPIVQAIPTQVNFGRFSGLQPVMHQLYIRSSFVNIGDRLIDVISDNPLITVSIAARKPGSIVCHVNLPAYMPAGDFAGQVTFRFGFPEVPEYRVFVRGRCVGGDIHLAPSHARLENIGTGNDYSGRIRIESKSRTPFNIRLIDPTNGIDVSWIKTDERGVGYDVSLNVDRARHHEAGIEVVTLETDREDQRKVIIPVVIPRGK